MGQVVYCARCQSRLTGVDLEQGRAFECDEGFVCIQCAPDAPTPKPATIRAAAVPADTTKRRMKSSTARLAPATPTPPPSSSRNKVLLLAGAGVALVVLVVLMAVLLSGKPEAPAPARAETSAPEKPKTAAAAPKEAPEAPIPWAVRVRKFAANQEFKAAMDGIEEARKTAPPGEVDRTEAEVLGEIRKRFSEALAAGREAREKKDDDAFKAARAKLEKWGLEGYVADFDKEFAERSAKKEDPKEEPAAPAAAPVPAGPRVRSDEGKAYLAKWQAAIPKAIARNYPAAAAELEKEKKGLKEADSKAEQAQDVKDLKLVEDLHKEGLQAAAKLTAGRKVKLGVLGTSGDVSTVEGEVVSADAERIEVRKGKEGGSSFVEPGELTAATLVDLVVAKGGKRPATHGRAAALLCLLSGDVEAAKKHLGAAIETLPSKYVDAAKDALQKLLPGDPSSVRAEREAKQLYWSAARDWESMDTLAAAVEKYKTLLREHIGKTLVVRNVALVTRRSEAGKEFAWLGRDLRGTGTFRQAKHDKLESVWVSAADSEGEALLRNWVEVPFCVLPGAEYRCWVMVGGCCKDTFTFYYQATELSITEKGQTFKPEPETMAVAPVKHQIGSLKKDHGACKKEKEAARWEWVAIPLPKFSAPGAKRVRILTDQKGFGVACAWVSSVRKTPPNDADLAEERKSEADLPGRGAAKDAGLVLHYSFEGITGASVEDLSGQGNAGSLKGGAKAGKLAGGPGDATLQFDGKDDLLVVPHSGSLDPGTGSFTVAAWLAVNGGEAWRLANKWDGKMGWLVDVHAAKGGGKATGKLRVKLNDGKNDLDLAYDAAIDAKQKWTHLALVVDRSANEARVYVNGLLRGQGSTGAVTGSLSNTSALAVGSVSTSKPDKFFKGHVDELKVFTRALGAAEIQALAGK